jgi:hypothetical protein
VDGLTSVVEAVQVSDLTGRLYPVPSWSMTATGLDVQLPDLTTGVYTLILQVAGMDRPLCVRVMMP